MNCQTNACRPPLTVVDRMRFPWYRVLHVFTETRGSVEVRLRHAPKFMKCDTAMQDMICNARKELPLMTKETATQASGGAAF